MNEQLKLLAIQAGLQNTLGCFWQTGDHDLERFAELIRADERDVCAALCLEPILYGRVENNRTTVGGNRFSRQKTYTECYKAIKERGLK